MARHRYVATMQPPSAVTHCVYCSLSRHSFDLVLAKGCLLEIFEVSGMSLTPKLKSPLHRRVFAMVAFRSLEKAGDVLIARY